MVFIGVLTDFRVDFERLPKRGDEGLTVRWRERKVFKFCDLELFLVKLKEEVVVVSWDYLGCSFFVLRNFSY